MNSKELAQYIEATNGISKPWLLVQLRLSKLQERKESNSSSRIYERTRRYTGRFTKIGRMVERN